jgi:hypothetical protein
MEVSDQQELTVMFWSGVAVAAAVLLGITLIAWLIQRFVERRRETKLAAWRAEFFRRREWLEARFLQIAGQRGTPRGLEWIDCDFDDAVAFARDRRSGELTALVAVGIGFRAVEGGGMEDVEAVGNRKAATAVFRHRGDEWTTDGRAVFNLNPHETIEHYQHELERVEE